MTYWVYILTNKNNSVLYIGVTNNTYRRTLDHKECVNKNSFTSRYNINKLVYYKEFAEITEAIICEKKWKKWKRIWKDALINENNPNWEDLFNDFLV